MGRIFDRGQSPDSILHVGGLVDRLPNVPCLCSRIQFFPLVRGSQVRTCFQHRVCRDEEEGLVRDQVITRATLGFLLGGLNCIYVLEDAFSVLVVLLHLFLECKDINVIQAASNSLELVQQLSQGDLRE